MPPSQNLSNYAFRFGFLRLATDSTAQSGFNLRISENDSGRFRHQCFFKNETVNCRKR
jgi:hypothetical protein